MVVSTTAAGVMGELEKQIVLDFATALHDRL